MIVQFKLNSEQSEIAKTFLKSEHIPEDMREGEEDVFFAGNMLGFFDCCYMNKNQNLSLDCHVLTYKGERHPLVVDGALAILKDIAGGDIHKLEVISYESSCKSFKWYETREDFEKRTIKSSLDLVEYLMTQYHNKHPIMYLTVRDGASWQCYKDDFTSQNIISLVNAFELPDKNLTIRILNAKHKHIYASFFPDDREYKIYRMFQKIRNFVDDDQSN